MAPEKLYLNDLYFAVYDFGINDIQTFDPTNQKKVTYGCLGRGDAEKATAVLFEEVLDYQVKNIDHKRDSPLQYALKPSRFTESNRHPPDTPDWLWDSIQESVEQNISNSEPLETIDIVGSPDFLVFGNNDRQRFQFVEVKKPPESLGENQIEWIDRFGFFDIKVSCVFKSQRERDRFVSDNRFSEIIKKARQRSESNEDDTRPVLSPNEISSRLKEAEKGDKILFNDRKEPLTVIDKNITQSGSGGTMTGIKVKSARGKSYLLSENGDWVRGAWRRSLSWVKILTK